MFYTVEIEISAHIKMWEFLIFVENTSILWFPGMVIATVKQSMFQNWGHGVKNTNLDFAHKGFPPYRINYYSENLSKSTNLTKGSAVSFQHLCVNTFILYLFFIFTLILCSNGLFSSRTACS